LFFLESYKIEINKLDMIVFFSIVYFSNNVFVFTTIDYLFRIINI
jgi:hypothetical protein